ncbi:Potassium channel [Mortierella claussenii]|nr:Potassium channel [Mortierella claussenii]
MWNPPPPDLQFNFSARPGSTRDRSQGANGFIQSNRDNLPRISPSNDRDIPFPIDNNGIIINHDSDQMEGHQGSRESCTDPNAMNRPTIAASIPHPRLEKVGPYLIIATLQAYTVLTVVRCLADPVWIVLKSGGGKTDGGPKNVTHLAEIGKMEKSFLACAIACTMLSCAGVTLRILDKLPWLRRIPVITAYLEAIFCIAALTSFLSTHTPLPQGGQFSHGFLACVITVVFSSIVAIMLTIDWWKGFPSAGLSATLKALIISSFNMTIVIIIGAAIYSSLEDWSFDQAVNFCIVSFATIGYGNLSPKSVGGRVIFFFYGLLGISSLGFFVVSLRNAVIEQFQWRLVERFSKPAHLTRVQTRMSAKDISFPVARFEEEQRVKIMVKRKMMVRMICIWIVMWFGGAGVFCAFETWTFLESLYFCFVTLTTIGFGDYVPNEPGSIEFWNVYVFVGLAVFAYILSLSSESMASQIHLVDDHDEDGDDLMYGWERNEDPNAPLTTRSGILGLEGLKWLHHQQHLQRQGSNPDIEVDEEGKPINNTIDNISINNNAIPNSAMGDGSANGDASMQSTYQRDRVRRKNSTGRILMVSAKERKQMLQAEYYATHSLPTAIRFVDTKGMPHQRTVRSGSCNSISGPSGVDATALSETTNAQQPMQTYGTIGYYGTIGRRDLAGLGRVNSLRRPENVGGGAVGVDRFGTMYGSGSTQPLNTVQTRQLQHQPLIKFGPPGETLWGTGVSSGDGRLDPGDAMGHEERRGSGAGYIPSCVDLFRQNNHQNTGTSAGNSGGVQSSSTAMQSQGPVSNPDPPLARIRSNSWDQSTTQHRPGPSQNEVHRWIAEDAGTLQGPNFNCAPRTSQQQFPTEFSRHASRPSESSEVTRVTSPPLDSSVESAPAGGPYIRTYEPTVEDRIAPDEIVMLLKTKPARMNSEEVALFQAGGDVSSTSTPSQLQSQSPGLTTMKRQPTLSSSISSSGSVHCTADNPPNVPQNLFLGGGVGAGYGRHAYGVLPPDLSASSRLISETASPVHPMDNDQQQEPIQLFDDDESDPHYTIHATAYQPMSLFSNHPRSGHNRTGASPSPSGSTNSSRVPSVLMTIFDEPVLNLPGSRTASRSNSLATPPSRSRAGSGALLISGQQQAQRQHSQPQSPAASETSIGPFDEGPRMRPHFDNDVDLTHVEASTQQVEDERQLERDLRRREREIEARLARLGAKGRADYQL